MRALVTGANGFVGRYLVTLLQQRGYDVCGTFYQEPDQKMKNVRMEELDITDRAMIRKVVGDFLPDEIYHLAAVSVTSGVAREVYYRVNFFGVCNLLDIVQKILPNSRVLIVSSANAYGQVPEHCLPIREEQEFRPINHYAAAKAAADMAACAYAADGMHVIRARPFNHTGPGQSTGFVCSRLAKLVAEVSLGLREPVIEIGNLASARDFTDVRDVVEAYYMLLQKGRRGEVYNVCSQKAYQIQEIINILEQYVGVEIKIKTNLKLMRTKDIPILLGSRQKIFSHIGWEPRISFKNTLYDLFEYWKTTLAANTGR